MNDTLDHTETGLYILQNISPLGKKYKMKKRGKKKEKGEKHKRVERGKNGLKLPFIKKIL